LQPLLKPTRARRRTRRGASGGRRRRPRACAATAGSRRTPRAGRRCTQRQTRCAAWLPGRPRRAAEPRRLRAVPAAGRLGRAGQRRQRARCDRASGRAGGAAAAGPGAAAAAGAAHGRDGPDHALCAPTAGAGPVRPRLHRGGPPDLACLAGRARCHSSARCVCPSSSARRHQGRGCCLGHAAPHWAPARARRRAPRLPGRACSACDMRAATARRARRRRTTRRCCAWTTACARGSQ
jgi:hypothetical protein